MQDLAVLLHRRCRARRPWLARLARLALLVLVTLAGGPGCGDDEPGQLDLTVPPAQVQVFEEFMALTGYDTSAVRARAGAPTPAADRLQIDVVLDLATLAPDAGPEAYRLDAVGDDDRAWQVHAGDLLGAQYGVAHVLELLGFRFRHPYDPSPPARPRFDDRRRDELGRVHAPTQTVRGLQLHTLHPAEAYYALWEPGPGALADARRIFDWIIKNRGNYAQWTALDDIMEPARHAAWLAHTQALLAHAHGRGLRVGLGMQLYGNANLQHGFDLYDDDSGELPLADAMAERLPLITDGLPFDVYSLAFGEFFDAEPQRFIDDVNTWSAAMATHAPAAEVHATVHVGQDQRVTYDGQDLLYYMLLAYADPRVVSDVHTVMFYNLYEDAGGAYHHDDFEEHRQYLLAQLRAGRIGAYVPETAYWVAFDNSVPLAMPLYVRNRWLDLDGLAADAAAEGLAPLHTHVLFTTGWEWGYWLHDVTALRASFALPASYDDAIAEAFGPELGVAAAAEVAELARAQATTLGDQRLVAYLSGRDLTIDAGRVLGVVSQPDRAPLSDLTDDATRASFAATTMPQLRAMADDLAVRARRVAALALPASRWARELVDGFVVTAARAEFVAARYEAALAHLAGDARATDAALAGMDRARADGAAAIARRHADLHSHHGAQLTGRGPTATLYQYGYLQHAGTMCYWERERVETLQVLGRSDDPLPDCFF